MEIRDMKTSTLQNKIKKVNKDIDKAHENANYEKLDDLLLLKNKLEVELEAR